MKNILWTTPKQLKKAIKGVYLDYYGESISDVCVERMVRYLREESEDTRGSEEKKVNYGDF